VEFVARNHKELIDTLNQEVSHRIDCKTKKIKF